MSFIRLLLNCRIERAVPRILLKQVKSTHLVIRKFQVSTSRIMAQRSITSFFKVSPPTKIAKDDKKIIKEAAIKDKEREQSPAINGVEKVLFH